jgi:hypothetical protein
MNLWILQASRNAPITKGRWRVLGRDSAEQERPSRRIVRTFQSDETSGRRCAHRTTHHQQNSTWQLCQSDSIVHAALQNACASDPGSAPQINDRVQYAFVVTDNPKLFRPIVWKTLSLSRSKLPLDYAFYIKSQITEPVKQLFSLVVHELPALEQWRLATIHLKPEESSEKPRGRSDPPPLPTGTDSPEGIQYARHALFFHVDLFSTSTCKWPWPSLLPLRLRYRLWSRWDTCSTTRDRWQGAMIFSCFEAAAIYRSNIL